MLLRIAHQALNNLQTALVCGYSRIWPAGHHQGQASKRRLPGPVLALALLVSLLWLPGQTNAAELLQVRGATQIQVGDRNRHYQVELACIQVADQNSAEATSWLRGQFPRGTKLNIRPLQADGEDLIARVTRLDTGQDLGEALIQAGLAQTDPQAEAC